MCGIFGYYNFKVSRDRRAIMEILFNGLRRLEYRGYDSAGIAIDADELTPQHENQPISNGPSRLGDPSPVCKPADTSAIGAGPHAPVPAAGEAGLRAPVPLPGSVHGSPTKSSVDSISVSSFPASELNDPCMKRAYSGGVGRDYKGRMAPVPLVIKSPGKVDALVKLAYQQLLDDDVCLDKARPSAITYLEISHLNV